jgi:hypothetical protein
MLKYNMNIFDKVLVTNFYDRTFRYECNDIEGYKNHLKNYPDMVECIGNYGQQIKPVFDIDAYNTEPNISSIITDINKIFPGKPIKYAKREPRDFKEKGIKYSYRVYVIDVRITSKNLKTLFIQYELNKNPIYDISIYDKNKILYLPLTTKKEKLNVPSLNPIDCDIFDCCASYIKEEYEDWDLKFKVSEEPKTEYKPVLIEDDDIDTNDKNVDFIKEIINNLNSKRAENYNDWLNVCFAIIGACKKSNIGKTSCSNLIHQFSKLSEKKYNENDVDDWIDENYAKQIERDDKQYGYKYLIHTCLKEDNFEYYDDKFNRSYKQIKNKFEKTIIKIDNEIRFIELFHDRDEFTPEAFRSLTKEQLHHKYNDMKGYKYIQIVNIKGNLIKKEINIVSAESKWWSDEDKRRCIKLIFKPCQLSEDLNKKYFNMFQGFRAQHLPVCKDYKKIEKILFHLKNVICNKNENTFNWFLKYLQAILKGEHTKVMIMIKGLEGCGKNVFLNMIAYGIIGSDYSIATSSPERQFFGNFNSLLINRVFAVINEGRHGMRECIDTIKDYITEDKINIEEKFKNPITLGNYINFIGDTNNWNILEISPTDRRFVWLECNNQYCGDMEYFNPLIDDCKDDECLSAFYHYLLEEVNDDIIDFQKSRPITTIYKKLQRINLSNPIKFLMHINSEGIKYKKYSGIEYYNYNSNELYSDYKNYCSSCKYEAFTRDNFESKITEHSNNGIIKGTYQRSKIFKFHKVEFDEYIKKFEDLEDLPIFDGDMIDDDE